MSLQNSAVRCVSSSKLPLCNDSLYTGGAGIDITGTVITNTDPGSAVTLANAGAGNTLVVDGTGPTLSNKSLTGGTGITLTATVDNIEIINSGVGGAPEIMYFSGGYLESIFNCYQVRRIPNGPTLEEATFAVPPDFTSLVSLKLIFIVDPAVAGVNKSITLVSEYGAEGEAYNNHTETDTSLYDFTGLGDKISSIDLSVVFSSIAAGDYCGLCTTTNMIGGFLYVIGYQLEYV